jgi:dimeric dUTPase (all-alpha-NTP-PPase superfamily)
MAKELYNLNWIRNLKDINSTALLEEFLLLFMALSDVELSKQKDSIK